MLLLRPGETFAGCRIISLCGSGGMGVVYLAEDLLHRRVALKIVALGNAERELKGIQQYIHAAENNPGMIRIYHAGIDHEQLYYVMEAADPLNPGGAPYEPKTLAAILKQRKTLPPGQVVEIIRHLVQGLQQLHLAHLIHRDIKPENIIFVNGIPKLCDPGLVCLCEATVSFSGTLGYLPPECFNGENLNSPDRDLYAMGMVFYVAVTGEVPSRYPRMPLSLHIAARKKLWPLVVRVCNANPRRRFASAAEFLAALPDNIPEPNWLDRISESFREYRLLHPHFVARLTLFLLIFLIGGSGLTAYQLHRSSQRTAYLEKCRIACRNLEEKLKQNAETLNVQLEAQAGLPSAQKFRQTLSALPDDPPSRLRQLNAAEEQLKTLALKLLPAIPEKTDDAGAELLSSQIRSLLNSPLGNWLPQSKRTQSMQKLRELEKLHIKKNSKLRAGETFWPSDDFAQSYVYVPAGAYRDRQGKIVQIKHAFWCGDSEISTYTFASIAGDQWLLSNRELPQVKFSWNDLIDFCREKTLYHHRLGILPEGYIFRPLTADEWYWAYRNAWHGEQKLPQKKQNQPSRAQAVYSGTPNELGLYNMDGNVSEITLSPEEEKMGNCVHLCGDSYMQKGANGPVRGRYLKYQSLPPFVGSRIAVVRGEMEFFDRAHWYADDRPLFRKERVYQCIAIHRILYSRPDADTLCELLGGHLCIPDDPELLKEFKKIFWESASFPLIVDAEEKEGKMVTAAGKPYLHLPSPAPAENPNMLLTYFQGALRYARNLKHPGFICEWSKTEYAGRTKLDRILKSRCIAHTFRHGSKLYALVLVPSITFPVRQIALILGAKLADPATPELREVMKKELAPWKHLPIFTGGSWKFDRWVQSDGSPLDLELKPKHFTMSNSINFAMPGIQEGEFYAMQTAQGFLLEFPLP